MTRKGQDTTSTVKSKLHQTTAANAPAQCVYAFSVAVARQVCTAEFGEKLNRKWKSIGV